MNFSLEEFLDWIYSQESVIFTYKCSGKNYIKHTVSSIDFCTIENTFEIHTIVCPRRKKDNQTFLRTIRKAVFEIKSRIVITYNLKDFLDFIPGKLHNICNHIYDVQLLRSIVRKPDDDDSFYQYFECNEIFDLFKKEYKNIDNKIYSNILLPCALIFSEIEKSGIPNQTGIPFYSYYKIHGTVSGRLSNERLDDNFINPLNLEKKNRNIVRAPDGYKLITVDYNAMEMRILTFLSQDPVLNHIFDHEKDVYSVIGQLIFNTGSVTENQRRIIKDLCFLIIYGGTEFGLSDKYHCSVEEARSMMNKFFELFSSVEEWILETQVKVLEDGFVESLFGRKRIFDVNDQNRDSILRQGQNFKIQSPANDISLMSVIELDQKLIPGSRILMSVHDCIIVLSQARFSEGNAEIMENVMKFPSILKNFGIESIRLKPVINIGEFWE